MRKLLPIIFILTTFCSLAQNFLPTQEPFGKNRIQYRPFKWKVLASQNFEIYFYEGGLQTATLAAQLAESEFDRITEILGYSPFTKTKIFVYNATQDLNQSNVGLNLSSEREIREENLAKSRIEIAYSGNAESFKKNITKDVAHVFVHDMLYGGSIKESLQNSLLLSVPEWYMTGITAYISEGWSTEMDTYMRDAITNKLLKKPNLANGKEAELIGQSIWNYVAEKYGKDNIANILNLTRIIRNEQTSISSTIGMPFSRFLKDWREYYSVINDAINNSSYQAAKYDLKIDENKFNSFDKISKFKISPDGAFIAYSRNELGKSSIEIMDVKTKKKALLLTSGYKTLKQSVDYNTPLLSWTKGGTLAVIYENQGDVVLSVFTDIIEKDLSGKFSTRKILSNFDQIQDFDISDNGTTIVLSAISKGQNDLFLYEIARGRVQQLTNDLYDDLSPQFVGSAGKVIFTSNRLKDSLDIDKGTYKNVNNRFNLFLHEGKPKQETVKRLVDSLGTISRPIVSDGSTVYFLSDERGIKNIYKLVAGDSVVVQVSNFKNDIEDFDFTSSTNSLVYKFIEKSQEVIAYQAQADFDAKINVPYSLRNVRLYGVAQASVSPSKPKNEASLNTPEILPVAKTPKIALEKGEIDTNDYIFDIASVTKNSNSNSTETPKNDKRNKVEKIIQAKQSRKENIKIKAPTDYNNPFVVNNTDLDFMVDPLPQRGFGLKGTINMNDLLENHHLQGGIFLTPNLKNADLWGEYQYVANRIDYSARFDRRSISEETESTIKKYVFNRFSVSASYPINTNTRIVATPSFTANRFLDLRNPSVPDGFSSYLGGKVEFVYDNTISHGINMLEGTRFRARLEHYSGISSSKDGFNRVFIDLRHYLKLGRGTIIAGRFSGGHSFGNAPKATVMGGMDNWLGLKYQDRTGDMNDPLNPTNAKEPRTDNKDIFLLDYATSLRGFNVNRLSGTSNFLFNVEVRFPIAKYLYSGPIYNNFFKNLQLTTFTDVGSAWTGASPFSRRNGFNTVVKGPSTNPFQATVTDFRNPFLIGYGFGARTTILGYFVKYDLAWGLDNNEVKSPISYITLGYDF